MMAEGHGLCSNQKIFLSLIILIILIYIFHISPVKLLGNYDSKKVFEYLIGFYFAIVVGHYLIAKPVGAMWIAAIGNKEDPVSPFDTSAIIGWVERPLYIIFLLLSKPEAIGIWLTLKTAGRIWGEEQTAKPPARTIYQIFLIGNALSIGYALVGWKIIECRSKAPEYTFLSIFSLCASSWILSQIIQGWSKNKTDEADVA